MAAGESLPARLERWSPRLYLVAGAVLILFPTNTALKTYVGTSFPVVGEVIAPAGFMLGTVALLGLYPALAGQTRRLGQVAGVLAAVCAANWFVIIVKNLGVMAGLIPDLGVLTAATGGVAFLTMILAYGLFGVASHRAEVFPTRVRWLMVLESLVMLHIIIVLFSPFSIPLFLFEIVHVVTHLGIGVTLRTAGVPGDQRSQAVDPTTGR